MRSMTGWRGRRHRVRLGAMLNEPNDALLSALKKIVGDAGWAEPSDKYLTEMRGLYQGRAAIILRPSSTGEVAACVRLCAEARVAIVPWGGGTGLVGGQVMPEGPVPVVLALDRMRAIRAVMPQESAMIVEAGLTVQAAQEAAADHGKLFPLSYASEGTASIGGGLSTNSGGLIAVRYGVARDMCLGVEVVTPQGEIWNGLSTLRKDNTGYDLRDLYIGAEGTLGIICAAALKLVPRPTAKSTAFATVRSPRDAVDLLDAVQDASGGSVATFELMARLPLEFVLRAHPDHREPVGTVGEWYVLAELWGSDEAALDDALQGCLASGLENGAVLDATIATNEGQRAEFRALREAMSDAQKICGGASIKHDVSLPISTVPEFLEMAGEAVTRMVPGARPCPFGHLGDGNIHYNISQPVDGDPAMFLAEWGDINRVVHEIVKSMNGSISAEHGIGRLKADELLRHTDSVKLGLLMRIKRALDPDGIMNPRAVLNWDKSDD